MGQGETPAETARETGESVYDGLLSVVVTGIAIIVPLVVTVWVLAMIVNFVARAFAPLVALLQWTGVVEVARSLWLGQFFAGLGIYSVVFEYVPEFVALAVLVGTIVGVGSLAHVRYGERIVVAVDSALADVPGVGTVYKSFRRVGDAMLGSEAENFEDVKIVEYPREGSYILGFETAESPEAISEAVGEDDLVAMFLPFAPNPVMGGYLSYIPEENVYDVDMTVEEGIRTIITSGIASGEDDDATLGNIPGVEHERDSPAKAD
ncbi:DUF502 domain-containing protein [Halorussus gelatinilyticus]|uniref:DUF502 domain-containing protein n=1 Tax=Halorussus gelatinilyticus TaxID=2937524 RepID=A0A8U0IKS3_9EURY|nr:DUF502 domain-containing protein [Halorussus gelatinilyticus]UPW00814.1 DUF502 domain-containing protein [Halorussus gelatinilyticus]